MYTPAVRKALSTLVRHRNDYMTCYVQRSHFPHDWVFYTMEESIAAFLMNQNKKKLPRTAKSGCSRSKKCCKKNTTIGQKNHNLLLLLPCKADRLHSCNWTWGPT